MLLLTASLLLVAESELNFQLPESTLGIELQITMSVTLQIIMSVTLWKLAASQIYQPTLIKQTDCFYHTHWVRFTSTILRLQSSSNLLFQLPTTASLLICKSIKKWLLNVDDEEDVIRYYFPCRLNLMMLSIDKLFRWFLKVLPFTVQPQD